MTFDPFGDVFGYLLSFLRRKTLSLTYNFQSVPGTEEKADEPTMTREEIKEQERLRYDGDTVMVIMMGMDHQEGSDHDRGQGAEIEI